jgi:predicted AAA+ superfamily ATPase
VTDKNKKSRRRYLEGAILELPFKDHKIALITGPRQSGKTSLAKQLLAQRGRGAYWNWDDLTVKRRWSKNPSLILDDIPGGATHPIAVFDEIHKASRWKGALKGFFDTRGNEVDILVTGSARMNIFRRGGDSLLGRFYHFRLHPFSLGEVTRSEGAAPPTPDEFFNNLLNERRSVAGNDYVRNDQLQGEFDALLKFGGFPEPFMARDKRRFQIWQRSRLAVLIREDLRDLSLVQDLANVETLCALLPERIGSLFSVRGLQEDLLVSYDSVKRWLLWLEELYYIYQIKPYQRRIKRSLKKEGKRYLWNWSEIPEVGARLENMVGSHLLKACDYWTDLGFGRFELYFLRTKDQQEIDFLIVRDGKPWLPIEVKSGDENIVKSWSFFLPQLKCSLAIQLTSKHGVFRENKVADTRLIVMSVAELLRQLV